MPQQIRTFHPEVVGLSIRNIDNAAYPLTVDHLDRHREAVAAMRDTTDAPLVLGGSGFSILPGSYLEALQSDWGIRGEGEQAFVTLLDALENGRSATGITGLLSRGRENVDDTGIMLEPERIEALTRDFHGLGFDVRRLFEAVGADYDELCDAVLRRKDEILREVGCPRGA